MRPQPIVSLVSLLLTAPVGLLFPTPYTSHFVPPVFAQTTQDRKADQLLKQGIQQYEQGKFEEALDTFQNALILFQQLGDRKTQGSILGLIGNIYKNTGQPIKALELYQQALEIAKTISDRTLEGNALNNIGLAYSDLGQYPKALEFLQQALMIASKVGDSPTERFLQRFGRGKALNNIGFLYFSQGQYFKALESYQQALAIYQELGERAREGKTLSYVGDVYNSQGQYSTALGFYQKALAIAESIPDRNGKGHALNGIGLVWQGQGYYLKALESYRQALAIRREISDYIGEGTTLNNIGFAHFNQGSYSTALELYEQALVVAKKIRNRSGESRTLNNIGGAYQSLGEYSKALGFYAQALAVAKKVGDVAGEGTTLNNIGVVYRSQKEYPKALEFYQQALAINKAVGDRAQESITLSNIGEMYISQRQYLLALESLQQALKIQRAIGDRPGEGTTLGNIGSTYFDQKHYLKALEFFQQALALKREVGDREGEGATLSNIGVLLDAQKQSELAIVFYKQSVNVRESIREDIRKLPRESQESYAQSVAGTYRNLADLLIQQGRLPEAQAVLELLKLRELREFTRDVGIDSPGINLATIEEIALKQILKQFTTLGNFTQKLAECETKQCPELKQIRDQRNALNLELDRELASIRVALANHYATQPSSLSPEKLNAEASRIVNAQPGTVLIYPLVLKDKVQFLLALKAGNGAVTFRPFETKVSAEKLFKTVQTFRKQLGETTTVGTPKADLATMQATSQQLYEWLIKPLEPELNAPGIKHIVFAPDLITRYIPLAALHNGKQYLIQRFTISTITAASKTDTEARVPRPKGTQSLLLAMGVSTFKTLNPLTNVPAELDAITKTNQPKDLQGIYPGSEFLNSTFDYEALQASLEKGTYQILHLATHGAFVAGRPENSYLVPGRGQNLTTELIDQLRSYGLGKIHLVVLSACETAVGDRASDGMEIPGISYFFLKNEVKAVMASLWNVNDASTALIMQQFYTHIAAGMTKAQALQTVQQDLINGKFTAKDAPKRSGEADIRVTVAPGTRASRPANFAHPYYWAPFILIGNSL